MFKADEELSNLLGTGLFHSEGRRGRDTCPPISWKESGGNLPEKNSFKKEEKAGRHYLSYAVGGEILFNLGKRKLLFERKGRRSSGA